MPTYHNNFASVAAAQRKTGTVPPISLTEQLASLARRLYLHTPRKTEKQRDLLNDVMRGRYPMRALEQLMEIAQISTRDEDRESMAELVRTRTTPTTVSSPNVAIAFDHETLAQGECDLAQRLFERAPTKANYERAIEALVKQELATRECILAVRRMAVA